MTTLPIREIDELIAAHRRNVAAMREESARKYGSAIFGTGNVQPDEADAFRAAPVWGAGL